THSAGSGADHQQVVGGSSIHGPPTLPKCVHSVNRKADQMPRRGLRHSDAVPRETRMNPVDKALWYVETHFAGELTLDEIAGVAGVSRSHVSRAFGEAIGQPITRYARGRRLTEAARALAAGAADILTVALEAGYGSHEAFTRAFREQFGQTPEAIRKQGHLRGIELMEPIKMEETVRTSALPVRFENGRILLIAGIVQRYTCETTAGIPSQWQRFVPRIGDVPAQIGRTTFGVRWNGDEGGD